MAINTPFKSGYYGLLAIICFYVCANPFIYATKFDPVRRVVVDLIACKNSQQVGGIVEMAGTKLAMLQLVMLCRKLARSCELVVYF